MNKVLLFCIVSSLLIVGCRKDKVPPPSITQILFPFFENSDIRMEEVSVNVPGQNIQDIFFFNEITGLVITYDGKIYKTRDGGMTWTLRYSNPIPDQPLYQILFTDENVGYIAGGADWCHGNNCLPPGGIILKTINGGENWVKIFDSGMVEFRSIARNSSGDLFITGNGSSGYPGQSFGKILKSHDGGFTWTIVQDTSHGLQRLVFNNGFGYCTGTSLFRSDDNGNSWNQTASPGLYTTDIGFSNAIGYCITDMHAVYKTTDNGDNWSQVFLDSESSSYKLNPLSATSCLIWGSGPYTGGDWGTNYGALRQTTNSGNTWTENEFSDIGLIQCASFYSKNNGYAVTRNMDLGSTLIKVTVK